MNIYEETGQTTVEYAIIAAAVILVFAAIMHLARVDLIGGWVDRTKGAFFVSARLDDFKPVWAEVQER